MTKTEARKMAAAIAKEVGAVKGTAHVGTWLEKPGVSIAICLDKKPAGLRYAIHNNTGENDCKVRLIEGDGRPGHGPFTERVIGTVPFDVESIVGLIKLPEFQTAEKEK